MVADRQSGPARDLGALPAAAPSAVGARTAPNSGRALRIPIPPGRGIAGQAPSLSTLSTMMVNLAALYGFWRKPESELPENRRVASLSS